MTIAVTLAWAWIHSRTAEYQLTVWVGRGIVLQAESRPYGVVFTSRNRQRPPERRMAFACRPVGSQWEISEGVEELMGYDPEPFPEQLRYGFGFAHTEWDQSSGNVAADGSYLMHKVDYRQSAVPYALLIALILLWPIQRWTRRWFRLRRIDRGRCTTCGYDIRGSPERCPECGLVPAALTSRRSDGRFIADIVLTAAGVVAVLLVLHLLLLPRMTPSGKVPQESTALPFVPVWAAPASREPDRMVLAAQPRLPNRGQAVWKTLEGDRLIVISLWGNVMFYEGLRVWEFDRSPRVVRAGEVDVIPDSTPYGLVEIRSDDRGVPPRYRSKWLLALVCWRPRQKYDPTKPVVLINLDDRRPNEVSLALVQWDSEQPEPENDAEKLLFAPDLKIRPAEDPPVVMPAR